MTSSDTELTVFDAVVRDPRIAQATTFLLCVTGAEDDRRFAGSAMRLGSPADVTAFGQIVGESLRDHFGAAALMVVADLLQGLHAGLLPADDAE
ncbi:hypothetical protein [Sulfobacillus sp. hq2]|uniref:hypothetical protein n=1 Tax=Sulfobacillus sp. hq2 TaxID=2039167 RepID=UPI000CD0ECE7|nr:hypothetical protein [Sulfobacillus sp. hq2]POB12202.1 hypothetical protein CO251_00820 [Sulfobacillus sp. hq2]